MKKIILMGILLLLVLIPAAYAGSRIVVVANSIDYANAADFIEKLDSKGRPVLRITAEELDAHNQEKFIIILGGPDAPDGIGVQVKALLGEQDQKFLREKQGNRKMFVKTNVWRKGQVVMIFAGRNRFDTRDIAKQDEPKVHEEATDEKIAELSQNTAAIEFKIENFNYSYNSSEGVWFFRWVEYSMSNKDIVSIDPMIDIELLRKEDGEYKQFYISTDVTHFTDQFKPTDNWIDKFTQDVRLNAGKYRLIVRLRDGADSAVVKQDFVEFTI